jgi:serine/threonine protein phosphatase PrpC
MPADVDEFLCASNTGLGWAFGTSRTGALHRKNNHPCEDAFALWSGSAGAEPCIAIAVADGHGDSRHDQSRTGSAIAVQSAVEELVSFHRMHLHDIPRNIIRSEFRADFPRRVSRRWRESVTEDATRRELAGPGSEETTSGILTRYGSTLIAASVLADTVLIGQIGDGDILLVRPDGTVESPIPGDSSLVGSETRSLSSRDAHLLWRTATLDRGEGGVLIAATDGVSDSFDGSEGPEFMKFIQSLVARIGQYGVENVAEAMSSWLDRYSELASGDDMTLVFVLVRPQAPANGIHRPVLQEKAYQRSSDLCH